MHSKGLTNPKTIQAIGGLNQPKVIHSLTRFALGKFNRSSINGTIMQRVLSAPGNK